MPALLVSKSPPLSGEVTIHGAKNSVLPILAATLLCRTPCVLHNCPDILDVTHALAILCSLGCAAERRGASVYIDPRGCAGHSVPPELAASMRASSLFLGALLARQGEASLSLPGGCPIGARPVDYHLLAFRALGAEVTETDDTIHCRARRLTGAKITLPGPSVGATENAMLAAVGAEGVTVIENAACEPEIVDLAAFLNAMGARICGAGTSTIVIEGVRALHAVSWQPISDRIEAGTMACACAITGGELLLSGARAEHLRSLLFKLSEAGIHIKDTPGGLMVFGRAKQPFEIRTMVYPGFPTDLQAPMMAVACKTPGTSVFLETIFENRFMHAAELSRLGAHIRVENRVAVVEGTPYLTGAPVRATDLRAGAALILAGLCAEGETLVDDSGGHIERGYCGIEEKLRAVGGRIERVAL